MRDVKIFIKVLVKKPRGITRDNGTSWVDVDVNHLKEEGVGYVLDSSGSG
jgi:hypothetical protein